MTYKKRLEAVTGERGRLCVGIDPHAALLSAWDLPLTASGLERYCRTVVEALGECVAVFKPQSAFFEVYGSAGIAALERVLADIAAAGANVVDVWHARTDPFLSLHEVQIDVEVETRGAAHREALVESLTGTGYSLTVS